MSLELVPPGKDEDIERELYERRLIMMRNRSEIPRCPDPLARIKLADLLVATRLRYGNK